MARCGSFRGFTKLGHEFHVGEKENSDWQSLRKAGQNNKEWIGVGEQEIDSLPYKL